MYSHAFSFLLLPYVDRQCACAHRGTCAVDTFGHNVAGCGHPGKLFWPSLILVLRPRLEPRSKFVGGTLEMFRQKPQIQQHARSSLTCTHAARDKIVSSVCRRAMANLLVSLSYTTRCSVRIHTYIRRQNVPCRTQRLRHGPSWLRIPRMRSTERTSGTRPTSLVLEQHAHLGPRNDHHKVAGITLLELRLRGSASYCTHTHATPSDTPRHSAPYTCPRGTGACAGSSGDRSRSRTCPGHAPRRKCTGTSSPRAPCPGCCPSRASRPGRGAASSASSSRSSRPPNRPRRPHGRPGNN